jgi:penicillin-binding protein 1A
MLVGLLIGYVWLWDMPEDESIRNPEIKQASKLLDTKGRYIGLYQSEFRNIIQYEEINPDIKKCLLAVEDARFYEHNGIDFRALGRVLLKSILMGDKSSGGGSTITQQLAKQLFPRSDVRDKNWVGKKNQLLKSKIKEWMIALKMEKIYSKDEIMTMYLNKFEFINGAHGIDAAAYTYFGKPQAELLLAEAAILVGMLKNPSLYNPARFPELVITRRNEVLSKVEEQHKVNLSSFKKSEADFSKFRRNVIYDTIAPYFKASLEKYLTSLIRQQNIKKPNGTYYDLYADGLTIESTIDLDIQKYAEEATREHMIWIQKWFDYDWVKKDPWTYNADEITKNIRLSSLHRKAKASLRYDALRKKHLNPFLSKWNFKVSEDDIALIIASDTMPEIMNDLSVEKSKLYKSVKKDRIYLSLVSAYQRLQADFLSEFNTKTKMKIFDSKSGLKSVLMTPMDSVKYHSKLLQTGLVAIDPRNGHVKCWNGGLNYNYFKYDHVTTRRSVGSTFKPFLYTVAMTEKGIKPCSEYKDTSYSILPDEGDFNNCVPWYPENATKVNTLMMYNLYHGLLYSKNSITVKLLKEIGSIEPLRNLLDRVGISKTDTLPNGRLAVPQLPSVALGAVDITLLQLTSAYTTFANNGIYRKPILIKTIKDNKGTVIYNSKDETNFAIDSLHNAIMLDMLINNEQGEFSMNLKSQNGGKTGTTDDQCDGWFVGLTPTLVVGSWTGGDDKWVRFLRDDVGQGYFTARPVFEKFIRKLEADRNGIYDMYAKFIAPPDGFKESTNCKKVKKERHPEFLEPQKPNDASLKMSSIVTDTFKIIQ